jgi:hypothetical protein
VSQDEAARSPFTVLPARIDLAATDHRILTCRQADTLSGGMVRAGSSAPASPHPAPYPGTAAQADQGIPSLTGGSAPLTACTPYVNGDTVHVSSGDASSHGWWLIGNCPNVKATVTNELQEYFSDKTWRTQATNSVSVYPSGAPPQPIKVDGSAGK